MHPNRLIEPDEYHWPEGPGRVFVGSMRDMFHIETDPEFVGTPSRSVDATVNSCGSG